MALLQFFAENNITSQKYHKKHKNENQTKLLFFFVHGVLATIQERKLFYVISEYCWNTAYKNCINDTQNFFCDVLCTVWCVSCYFSICVPPVVCFPRVVCCSVYCVYCVCFSIFAEMYNKIVYNTWNIFTKRHSTKPCVGIIVYVTFLETVWYCSQKLSRHPNHKNSRVVFLAFMMLPKIKPTSKSPKFYCIFFYTATKAHQCELRFCECLQ